MPEKQTGNGGQPSPDRSASIVIKSEGQSYQVRPVAVNHLFFDIAKTVRVRRLYFRQGKGLWEVVQGSHED